MITQSDIEHVEATIDMLKRFHLELHRADYRMSCGFNPEAHRALTGLASSTLHALHTMEGKLADVKAERLLPIIPSESTSQIALALGEITDRISASTETLRAILEEDDVRPA